tara:strand:- start:647 stop:808 length:162 start_codon:yes stop_codon:yes gene_type:complete
MKRRVVRIEVLYDTEETWEKSLKDIEEVFLLMENITRRAKILEIGECVNADRI